MSYPGNPSLAPEVQGRLLETFAQSLDLAAGGSTEESLLGCDFLLRMDPAFEPARTLLERLKAWRGTGGLDVEDLRASVSAQTPAAPAAHPPAAHPVVMPIAAMRSAVSPAAEVSFADLSWSDREPETGPYVARFLRDARAALAAGQRTEAERLVAKARVLDEKNPEVEDLAQEIASQAESFPPPAADDVNSDFLLGPIAFSEISDLGGAAIDGGAPDRSSQEDPRIAELLAQGQAAFDRSEHQNAIDAWSRVFLIDIDHAEASRRIEEARRFKAEAERKLEEIFQEAATRLEDGDREGAREALTRLLAASPGHMAARELMERVDSASPDARGEAAAPRRARAGPAAEPAAAAVRAKGKGASPGVLKEEIMVPPEPGETRASAATPPVEVGRAGRKARASRGPALAVGGLLIVIGAGAWLWTQRDRLFPNRAPAAASVAAARGNSLERAKALHSEGKTSAAVAHLRRIAADDPLFAGAQALITEWEALEPPAAAPGLDPETAERRSQLVGAARQALVDRRYVVAAEWLRQAGQIAPLDAETADLERQARAAVLPYTAQLELFRQGEWAIVLPALWRLREADPENRDVTSMIVDCYFNLGVRELQRESPAEAVDKFREALNLAPDDRDLRRTANFAEAYRSGNLDLQYKIFVKYLPFRSGAAA